MALQSAIVKSVLSGDTIVLRGQPRNGPPPERILCLAQISAPRLGRRPNASDTVAQKDEPCAWESREYLRRKLVGKTVRFRVEYTVPSGREYGTIILEPGTVREENVTVSLLKNGLAKIRDGARGEGEEFEAMQAAQVSASEGKLGVWAEDAIQHVRDVTWNIENPRAFVDSFKSKPIKAVIEQVRDGCTVRAFLLPNFEYVTVMFSGVKTPIIKRNTEGQDVPEPFAAEAKFYVESRLLQREVSIVLEGVSNNNFLGTVLHPQGGNISLHLLKDGFAKIVDWTIGNVTQQRDQYRTNLKQAQTQRLRLWRNWTPPAISAIPASERSFKATVEEIHNAESMTIRSDRGVQKIHLASLRGPKAAPLAEGEKRSRAPRLWEIPYAYEAREFLRKKLIGKKVDVTLDYINPANNGYPEKHCCTVVVDKINVSEALISKGFATALRHKSEDDQRSSAYDDLMAAETRAIKNKKGLHGNKGTEVARITEVNSKQLADRFLPSMQRSARVLGVVEYVTSGSRFRVMVPKDSCIIQLVLAGISCPRTGRDGQADEPFSREALEFARKFCLQQDVEVEAEDTDRAGNIVGHLHCKHVNLSSELLERGFASVHSSVDRYKHAANYKASEQSAKDNHKGMFASYDPNAVAAAEEARLQAAMAAATVKERKTDYKPVVITEVASPTTIWTQSPDTSALNEVMRTIRNAFANNPPVAHALTPKRNDLVAAQFSQDMGWYRARITEINGNDVDVLYVDYGNSETVDKGSLAALPIGTTSLPPQASQARLAFLKDLPSDWAGEGAMVAQGILLNRKVELNQEYTRDGTPYVTIKNDGGDLIENLLLSGYGIVEPRREAFFQDLLRKYLAAQTAAKKDRKGIWIYGDVDGDDEL
eukprot:TRINITY_DN9622_c0_g1_i1.p2 TRINITY_DN9622_c0_g1~~TRINITY_DN9622_c0_g1_i1.p2  ORF type:complete len:879 (+),score=258.12 TRINITY_DN9622_c0_g1_i1:2861-5497(+)